MTKKRNVAIYCRVSTDSQAEFGYSLRDQEIRIKQYIRAYAEDFTEPIVSYIDDGYSAKDLRRKEMQRLINDIKNGEVSKVVIHNHDRLTRNILDLMILIELFEEYDVQLYSIREKIDTKTAIGRLFVSIIVLIAQWEREAISERTIRGMDRSFLEGNWVNGNAPFGYDVVDKKLVVNPIESELIKQIYDMYIFEERTFSNIWYYLLEKHNNLGFEWSEDRVKSILRNELYIGTGKNKRYTIENHYPAIISEDLYRICQKEMEVRNRKDSHIYPFRNKCYDSVTFELLSQHSAKGKYQYYRNKQRSKMINQNIIDEQIAPIINQRIDDIVYNAIEPIINTLSRKDRREEAVNYYYHTGLLSVENKDKIAEKVKRQKYELESTISLMNRNITYWEEMEMGEKIKFIKLHVEKIIVNFEMKRIEEVTFFDLHKTSDWTDVNKLDSN